MTIGPHPYPAYRPSGVDWLGEVPEHWEVRRLKAVCRLAYGDTLPSEARCDGEVPVYGSNGPVGTHTEANTKAPCIIVGRKGSFGKAHYSPRPVFAIDTTYVVDERYSTANLAWLYLVLHWARLDEVSRDSAVPGLNREEAYSRYLPLPPLPEQGAIVRYLDHADRRIRRYAGAKRRLIALLEEERQAVIDRAVTRGLDPGVRLRPSGVDWLGDVPAHWEVRRIRTIADMRVSNVDKHTKEDEFPVRLCNYVDVYKNDRITEAMPFMNATASWDEIERFRLQPGDVLITKDSEAWDDIGVPSLVVESADDLLSGYHLALLRPFEEALGAYLALTLQSRVVAYQFHVRANGVTRFGLTHTGIQSVQLPLPPLPEQCAIVEYIDKATEGIDAAIARARRQIELVEEYRTRLVADVVTGKLDVREASSRLPGEVGGGAPAGDGAPSGGLYVAGGRGEDAGVEEEVTA